MSEDPDLERRLEAMFASARPRREFEDQLWRRIEASRPWRQRLRTALRPSLRFAPALAALLVVALGATWLVGNHGLLGGGASTTSSSAGSSNYGPENSAVAPGFGQLPALVPHSYGTTAPAAPAAGNADSSVGLTFNGSLPSIPQSLPVYRYDEPSASDLSAAVARLKAAPGIPIAVAPSNLADSLEPSFSVSGPAPSAPLGSPIEAASAFLTIHSLTPSYSFQVSQVGPRQVVYGRLFDGPNGPIPEVRRSGAPAGLTVDLGDAAVSASGPVNLALASAPYPLRAAADSLVSAGLRTMTGPAALNRAQLVYALVIANGHGYYEPALLLTGPGVSILAPLVAPAWVAG